MTNNQKDTSMRKIQILITILLAAAAACDAAIEGGDVDADVEQLEDAGAEPDADAAEPGPDAAAELECWQQTTALRIAECVVLCDPSLGGFACTGLPDDALWRCNVECERALCLAAEIGTSYCPDVE